MGMAITESIPLMPIPPPLNIWTSEQEKTARQADRLRVPRGLQTVASRTSAFASLARTRRLLQSRPGLFRVPGRIQADPEEGLDKVLAEAGFEIRQPGCSACLAMNDDKVPAGKYVVSTSNRNFRGRQGPGSRTLLASPLTAAAAAVTGIITDPRALMRDA